jgi:hypothetical protein
MDKTHFLGIPSFLKLYSSEDTFLSDGKFVHDLTPLLRTDHKHETHFTGSSMIGPKKVHSLIDPKTPRASKSRLECASTN